MYFPDPDDELLDDHLDPTNEFDETDLDDRTGVTIDPKKEES